MIRKPKSIERKSEVFESKRTKCLQCLKTIKNGDQSWVVKNTKGKLKGKVVARFCSKDCEDVHQANRMGFL